MTIDTCPISSFEFDDTPQPMDYIIGSAARSDSTAYSFTQVENCMYEEGITISPSNLPFVTHRELTNDFEVYGIELGVEGPYEITITA